MNEWLRIRPVPWLLWLEILLVSGKTDSRACDAGFQSIWSYFQGAYQYEPISISLLAGHVYAAVASYNCSVWAEVANAL
jgi:hypothetical protein